MIQGVQGLTNTNLGAAVVGLSFLKFEKQVQEALCEFLCLRLLGWVEKL
ncbi:MAG: hypothetical protein ACRBBO_13330 [Cognatishimia sp.]